MKISTNRVGSILTIHLDGRVDATNSHDFEKQTVQFLTEKNAKVLFNLKNLEYISSAGLRSFLIIAKTSKNFEQTLALCEMSPNIDDVFKITGFQKLFTIYATSEIALQSLEK